MQGDPTVKGGVSRHSPTRQAGEACLDENNVTLWQWRDSGVEGYLAFCVDSQAAGDGGWEKLAAASVVTATQAGRENLQPQGYAIQRSYSL